MSHSLQVIHRSPKAKLRRQQNPICTTKTTPKHRVTTTHIGLSVLGCPAVCIPLSPATLLHGHAGNTTRQQKSVAFPCRRDQGPGPAQDGLTGGPQHAQVRKPRAKPHAPAAAATHTTTTSCSISAAEQDHSARAGVGPFRSGRRGKHGVPIVHKTGALARAAQKPGVGLLDQKSQSGSQPASLPACPSLLACLLTYLQRIPAGLKMRSSKPHACHRQDMPDMAQP